MRQKQAVGAAEGVGSVRCVFSGGTILMCKRKLLARHTGIESPQILNGSEDQRLYLVRNVIAVVGAQLPERAVLRRNTGVATNADNLSVLERTKELLLREAARDRRAIGKTSERERLHLARLPLFQRRGD